MTAVESVESTKQRPTRPHLYEGLSVDERITQQGECNSGTGGLVELFFASEESDINRAKAICGSCAVRAECLDTAIERREPWGVWGGELFYNGKIVTKQ